MEASTTFWLEALSFANLGLYLMIFAYYELVQFVHFGSCLEIHAWKHLWSIGLNILSLIDFVLNVVLYLSYFPRAQFVPFLLFTHLEVGRLTHDFSSRARFRDWHIIWFSCCSYPSCLKLFPILLSLCLWTQKEYRICASLFHSGKGEYFNIVSYSYVDY